MGTLATLCREKTEGFILKSTWGICYVQMVCLALLASPRRSGMSLKVPTKFMMSVTSLGPPHYYIRQGFGPIAAPIFHCIKPNSAN
jgi:hypothetical protein